MHSTGRAYPEDLNTLNTAPFVARRRPGRTQRFFASPHKTAVTRRIRRALPLDVNLGRPVDMPACYWVVYLPLRVKVSRFLSLLCFVLVCMHILTSIPWKPTMGSGVSGVDSYMHACISAAYPLSAFPPSGPSSASRSGSKDADYQAPLPTGRRSIVTSPLAQSPP